MLRAPRLLAATLAATALALPAVADARAVSASFEARFVVLATCSIRVADRVAVACASPATPFRLDAAAPAPAGASAGANAGADAGRVTVYF